jgi:hypothetical protein
LVFPVVSFLLAFPSKSYMHSSSPHTCYMPGLSQLQLPEVNDIKSVVSLINELKEIP